MSRRKDYRVRPCGRAESHHSSITSALVAAWKGCKPRRPKRGEQLEQRTAQVFRHGKLICEMWRFRVRAQ